MSRVYPSIQGCPFRKVINRVLVRGFWTEYLSCGHMKVLEDQNYILASKRRCYNCKAEKERSKKK